MDNGCSFPRGKAAGSVKLTTHFYLELGLRMRPAIPPLPQTSSCRGAYYWSTGHIFMTYCSVSGHDISMDYPCPCRESRHPDRFTPRQRAPTPIHSSIRIFRELEPQSLSEAEVPMDQEAHSLADSDFHGLSGFDSRQELGELRAGWSGVRVSVGPESWNGRSCELHLDYLLGPTRLSANQYTCNGKFLPQKSRCHHR
jgi:hypothetical protein